MVTLPVLLSILYFTAFAIYILFGLYALNLNYKSGANRVFCLVCLSLGVWSFGISIAYSIADSSSALLWHRVAALGWTTIFAFLLHFILILTKKHHLLERGWLYAVIYAPAVLLAMAYSIADSIAPFQHIMYYSPYGWIDVPAPTYWNLFFNGYFGVYVMAVLALVWQWGKNAARPENGRQARILLASFAVAVVLGTATDIVLVNSRDVNVPEMGAIVTLIPITAIALFIKKYGLMKRPSRKTRTEEDQIISEANRARIYFYLSLSYVLGAFLNFISRYFLYQAPLEPTIIFSCVLLIIAAGIALIQRTSMSEDRRDFLSLFLICLSVPLVSLNFIEYASLTVWAAPFILVIISIIFNRPRMIVLISLFIVTTQLAVWYLAPNASVQIDSSDHIVRLGLFVMTLWLAFFINRVYISRLKENQAQVRFQEMIAEVSSSFVSVTEGTLDEKIKDMLKLSGESLGADRCYFFEFEPDKNAVKKAHEWRRDGIEPPEEQMPYLIKQDIPMDKVLQPPETGLTPVLAVPVQRRGQLLGCLEYEIVNESGLWKGDHRKLLLVMANLLADALARVEAEKEINNLAFNDPLTGLPNRILFNNRLEQAISLAERTGRLIAVMLLDLDYFKSVNDTMGHEGGDELLRQVASRLSETLRRHDTVSRFGGDEFLIMLTNIDQADNISKIAGKILQTFERPAQVQGQEFYITASAGIAIYPYDGTVPELLIKNADLAMYASKSGGRNQYTLCSALMKEDVEKKMKLTNSLYRAQERNELVLYYQPQVCVATRRITGLEALIRWRHPELGLVPPAEFIPLAEQTGLINPIGKWVLATACRQNKMWQEMGNTLLRMAVNLSVEQFRNPSLVKDVQDALLESGLEAHFLELEITESVAVKETGHIINVLNALKELGVTIAIDDFGTEYSSLSRLKMLPVDRIKMDMQFIHGLSTNAKDDAIARVIIQLARNLDLKVIAEGVETEPQMEFLVSHVCDEVQGFYFCRPMPAEEIESILFNGGFNQESSFELSAH